MPNWHWAAAWRLAENEIISFRLQWMAIIELQLASHSAYTNTSSLWNLCFPPFVMQPKRQKQQKLLLAIPMDFSHEFSTPVHPTVLQCIYLHLSQYWHLPLLGHEDVFVCTKFQINTVSQLNAWPCDMECFCKRSNIKQLCPKYGYLNGFYLSIL